MILINNTGAEIRRVITLINNTGVDIREFETSIRNSITHGVALDDAISDLFIVRKIQNDRYAIEFL